MLLQMRGPGHPGVVAELAAGVGEREVAVRVGSARAARRVRRRVPVAAVAAERREGGPGRRGREGRRRLARRVAVDAAARPALRDEAGVGRVEGAEPGRAGRGRREVHLDRAVHVPRGVERMAVPAAELVGGAAARGVRLEDAQIAVGGDGGVRERGVRPVRAARGRDAVARAAGAGRVEVAVDVLPARDEDRAVLRDGAGVTAGAGGLRRVRSGRRVPVAGAAGRLPGADEGPDRQRVRAAGVERRAVAVGRAGGRRAIPDDGAGERAPGEVHRAVRVRRRRREGVAGVAAERAADRAAPDVRLVRAHRDGRRRRLAGGRDRRGGVRLGAVAGAAAEARDLDGAVDVPPEQHVDLVLRIHRLGVAPVAERVRGVGRGRRRAVAGAAGGLAGADVGPDGPRVRPAGAERGAVAVGRAGRRGAVPRRGPGERAPLQVDGPVRVEERRRQRVAVAARERRPQRAVPDVRLVRAHRDGGRRRLARGRDGRRGVRARAVAGRAARARRARTVPSTCRPPATRMRPSAPTVPAWQPSQVVAPGCGAGGGTPWQVPQAAWPAPTWVQTGSGVRAAGRERRAVAVGRAGRGAAIPRHAARERAPGEVHGAVRVQRRRPARRGRRRSRARRGSSRSSRAPGGRRPRRRSSPTRRSWRAAARGSRPSRGRSCRPRPATWTAPSMCRPRRTSISPCASTVSGWQPLQRGFAGCGAGGGLPWQVPQAVWPAPTRVHTGSVFVPPAASVAPWQ